MLFRFGFTLTINRYGATDKFGRRPAPTTHTVDGCAVAPEGSVEQTGDQVLTLDSDVVYAPFDADVVPTDELVIPSGQAIPPGIYQVNGRPERWSNPLTGTRALTKIRLTRASGS